MAALGLQRTRELPHAIAYGDDARAAPYFWLLAEKSPDRASAGVGLHISFQAPDHASVRAFHDAALAAGGTDAGAPGPRPQYTQPFYGAFALDPDGFKIEAVCRT